MFSSILTGGLNGMEAYLLQAEVDISHGLPTFCMVGSLSNEVREAKERIQVALKNAGFDSVRLAGGITRWREDSLPTVK